MTTKAEEIQETEETTQELEVTEQDTASTEEGENSVEESEGAEEEEELSISIEGEDTPPQEDNEPAPGWVKELRKAHKDTRKENKALKAELEALKNNGEQSTTLGEKPTLESCNFDSDQFEKELTEWHDNKKKYDDEQKQKEAEQQKEVEIWESKIQNYEEKKKSIKVKDFEEAEINVQEKLSKTQLGIIIEGSKDPSLIVLALDRNPKKLEELSNIKRPVEFAFAVAKLEDKMKVTNRKASTKPETVVNTKAGVAGTIDANLEKLRKEAATTGNYTKLHKYKQQIRDSVN